MVCVICSYHWMTFDEMCLASKVLLGNWVALKLHLCWTSCRITSALMKTDPTTSTKRWKWEWSQPPWIASLTFCPQLQLRKMKTTGMKWWVGRDGLPILFPITELCNTTLHAWNGVPWKKAVFTCDNNLMGIFTAVFHCVRQRIWRRRGKVHLFIPCAVLSGWILYLNCWPPTVDCSRLRAGHSKCNGEGISDTSVTKMKLEKWRIILSTTCTCMLILQVY